LWVRVIRLRSLQVAALLGSAPIKLLDAIMAA
jgi:hypothetical protein